MFYNGFENRGYSPNLGENYPFQFSFQFQQKNDGTPINQFAGCSAATPTGGPTLETGFACVPLDPLAVNAQGLQLRGIQFAYQTPYSIGDNLTIQYQLTPSMSVQAAYVGTFGRHLEVFPGSNNPTRLLPPNTTLTGSRLLAGSPAVHYLRLRGAYRSQTLGKTQAMQLPRAAATITVCKRVLKRSSAADLISSSLTPTRRCVLMHLIC
jgi:hypothetical protein